MHFESGKDVTDFFLAPPFLDLGNRCYFFLQMLFWRIVRKLFSTSLVLFSLPSFFSFFLSFFPSLQSHLSYPLKYWPLLMDENCCNGLPRKRPKKTNENKVHLLDVMVNRFLSFFQAWWSSLWLPQNRFSSDNTSYLLWRCWQRVFLEKRPRKSWGALRWPSRYQQLSETRQKPDGSVDRTRAWGTLRGWRKEH